jgi:peptidoglycan/LPS O-acetylase OafA/YrhL
MAARRDEILPLTGLRALAAWWVVGFHFVRRAVDVPALRQLLAGGHVAVDLFFVLSGFVLTARYGATDFADAWNRKVFWRRRFARIYPLYVVSLALGFYAEWPGSARALATASGLTRLAAQLTLLNSFSHLWMFRLNWAAWSLSVEAFFYALFPWLLPWISRRSPRRVIAVCCLAALVAPALYSLLDPDHFGRALSLGDEALWSWYLKFFPLQRLPMFMAGIATAQLARELRPPPFTLVAAIAALLAILVTAAVPYAFLQGGALLPLFVAVLLALGSGAGVGARAQSWLASPVMVALGRASYATYILHVPLFLAMACFDPVLQPSLPHVMGYVGMLLVVSMLAHRFIEEPARRAVTRWSWGSAGAGESRPTAVAGTGARGG